MGNKTALIPNGYYLKARKISNSEISKQPPHVREIWDWLIKEANHRDNGNFKRGQCLRTYKDIINGLQWFVGYRKMSYTISQCENAMKWYTKRGMITKSKTTRGLIITICNYGLYQTSQNYESQTETDTRATTEPQPRHTINKNDKKLKNVIIKKKKGTAMEKTIEQEYFLELLPVDSSQEFIEAWSEWLDYCQERKNKITKLTAKKQINFLLTLSNPGECISRSIRNGWRSLWEVKNENGNNGSKSNRGASPRGTIDFDKYAAEREASKPRGHTGLVPDTIPKRIQQN